MQSYDQFAAVKSVEHFLEHLIADYGVELYLAFYLISLVVIAWIIARNVRRRGLRRGAVGASTNLVIVPTAFVVAPPALTSAKHPPFPDLPPFDEGDDEGTAFSA